ncbi:hypothetical protein N7478_004642 [Penicillium angulare]|uniref:uncharacterized protein n=1 Tax=Penicillium angulare TaxID=116970 RepID=UPI002541CEFB|nr:uncharacterized protein N7478_004642 [Penicillium angulare]KAJ5279270.1 hypothetical protein N7478_004642 [Penicillium angulare]
MFDTKIGLLIARRALAQDTPGQQLASHTISDAKISLPLPYINVSILSTICGDRKGVEIFKRRD